MAQTECRRCNGTGWANAARDSGMEDAPIMQRPLGVYRCDTCGGTGKIGMTEEDEALLVAAAEKALKKLGK